MRSALLKDTVKEIKNTFKRFLSILLVVLLGVGFFAGIKTASPDMKMTIDKYFDDQNVMDIQVLSTLGLTDEDIKALSELDGVEKVEGTYSQDVIVSVKDEEAVIKLESLSSEMNMPVLVTGRMPEKENECIVEESMLSWTGCKLGDTIEIEAEKITDDDGNKKNLLKQNTLTIVGSVQSPMYISRERGSSKLGSGKINYYMYIPESALQTEIYTNVYVTVKDAKEVKSYSAEYEDLVESVKDKIEEIADSRETARYDEIYKKANDKIEDAQKELDKEKKKADKEIKNAQTQIDNAKKQLSTGKTELAKNKKTANEQIANGEKQIKAAEKELEQNQKLFDQNKAQAQSQIAENEKMLEALKAQGAPEAVIQEMENGISKAKEELANGEKSLQVAKQQLEAQKKALSTKKSQAESTFKKAEKELQNAQAEITKNESKLKKAKKEADEKIKDAEKELDDARESLKDIEKPTWYILDRNQNIGYVNYIQDSDRVANLASVFPVVFFVVAALISLTSMSRMVEEQRVQIGTLKALGYTKVQIASKYIIYALLATVIGSAIGLSIGFHVLPRIIINIYGMMYVLPEAIVEFNLKYTVISVGLACLCTVGATIYSCSKELSKMPAKLMRPKAPKPGKRVLLEKITFIWKHLSFTQKVTARNIFRYKKRFLMTIIGVMGCTSLILAGFVLKDSIGYMLPMQYGDIYRYDVQVTLKDVNDKKVEKEINRIANLEETQKIKPTHIQSVEITNISNNQNIQLIVPENLEDIDSFIRLRARENEDEKYTLDNEGVIITEKLSKLLKLNKGDTIIIKNSEDIEVETKIANITENYLMHYIYMSPELYEKLYKEEFKANSILVIEKEGINEEILGQKILEDTETVSGVGFNSRTEGMFSEIMDNMNLVVWILIISAGLLAFVVLYNLANTNISERIRELATIKVLGFYDNEVYSYIGKEMIILTIIGMLIGLVGGYFLGRFIIKTTELDILMFTNKIEPVSYIYSIVITAVFAIIVNIATYISLKKINMVESLKSVE